MSTPRQPHPDRRFLILLSLAAFALRLLYLHESRNSPFFDTPIVDAKDFLEQALRIAGGDWLSGDKPFWQPPLYPYFLALLCAFFPSQYFMAIRIAQMALGTLSCVLIFDLGRQAFGRRIARVAAALAAAYGVFIYFEGELLAVSLEIALNLILIRSVLWALDRSAAPRRWLLVGAIAGTAALARPNILLFVGVLCLWLVFRAHSLPHYGLRHGTLTGCLYMGITLMLVLLPVTARNYLLGGDVVLISHNAGINFYIGNNARYDSTVAIHPGRHWEDLVAEPMLAGIHRPSARSRYYFRKSAAYIIQHPLDYTGLMAKKLWLFLNGAEIKRNQDVYFARRQSKLLGALIWKRGIAFPFGLVIPFALLGIGLTWCRKAPAIAVVRLYALSYSASVLLFFVTARYRLPVVPAVLIFAAWAMEHLYGLLRARAWRRVAPWAIALPILAGLLNMERASDPTHDAQLYEDLGEAHLRKHQYGPALRYLRRALALEPGYSSALHNMAVAYMEQGDYTKAETAAREALRWHAPRADTHAVLAKILLISGKPEQAEREFKRSLKLDPGRAATHYEYARMLLRQRRFVEAVGHLRQAHGAAPEYWVRYDMGRALRGTGHLSDALAEFRRASGLAPKRPEAWIAAGAVLLTLGDHVQARESLNHAIALAPDDPSALANLGLLELTTGHPRRAVRLLQRALSNAPAGAASGIRNALSRARAAAASANAQR